MALCKSRRGELPPLRFATNARDRTARLLCVGNAALISTESSFTFSRSASVALALLSAGLQVLAFPSPALAWVAWIAFVPLLIVLLQRPLLLRHAFLFSYLCGIAWYAGTCYWIFHSMHYYGGISSPASLGIVVLFCLYLGLYHGIFGWLMAALARRRAFSGMRILWVAPFVWVAVEFARYHVTGFPWDLLGTAIVDNLALIRIAPFTGVWGLSWLILAVNAWMAAAVLQRHRRTLVAGIVAIVILQIGNLLPTTVSPATRRARLVQENLPILDQGWTPEFYDTTLAELVELSRNGIAMPPATFAPTTMPDAPGSRPKTVDVVIWPESPAPFYTNEIKFRSWISTLAAEVHAPLIVGSIGAKAAAGGTAATDARQYYNSALLVSSNGNFESRYDKIRLVPFGEYVPFQRLLFFAESLTKEVSTFARGERRVVFPLGQGGRAGVFICYESVFPDEVRQFVTGGATVLVNISNDGWFGETGAPGQHLNMARMRAIENRRWLLRATNTGITAAIDPYGRVVTRAERNSRLALDVPFDYVAETTFYTRHGDWFPWTCAIIVLAAAGVVVKKSHYIGPLERP